MSVRFGDFTVTNNFAVTRALSVPRLLGTTYSDKENRAIMPPEGMIVPCDYPPM